MIRKLFLVYEREERGRERERGQEEKSSQRRGTEGWRRVRMEGRQKERKKEKSSFRSFLTIHALIHNPILLLLSHFSRARLCDPIDGSPPGSPVPGILQARTLEWVAISFSNA